MHLYIIALSIIASIKIFNLQIIFQLLFCSLILNIIILIEIKQYFIDNYKNLHFNVAL